MLAIFTKNKSLRVLIIINIIFLLGASMFPPIFALFVKEIGGSVFSAGSIWATFAVFTGFLTFLISRFGNRIKEKEYLVAAGYFLRFLAWLGYFFSTALWQLYILQLVLALAESIATPSFLSIFSEHLDKGQHIKQWGSYHSLKLVVVGLASLLGGAISSYFGFRTLFLVMAGIAIFSFILIMIQPRKLL